MDNFWDWNQHFQTRRKYLQTIPMFFLKKRLPRLLSPAHQTCTTLRFCPWRRARPMALRWKHDLTVVILLHVFVICFISQRKEPPSKRSKRAGCPRLLWKSGTNPPASHSPQHDPRWEPTWDVRRSHDSPPWGWYLWQKKNTRCCLKKKNNKTGCKKRKKTEKWSESSDGFSVIFNDAAKSFQESLPGLKLTELRRAIRRRFATVDCFANHGWFLRASNSCTVLACALWSI